MTTWTIQAVMIWSMEYLKDKGVEQPRLDVELLLSHALQVSRIQLYVSYDQPMQEQERNAFRELLKSRGEGVPVAYLLGSREFMGLDFHVQPGVLIPRPDTETLVEVVLERAADQALQLLDIGVGSGCVGLSLLHLKPQWHLTGWDVDPLVLKQAENNAIRLSLQERAQYNKVDALDAAQWSQAQWDVIVSNPPYIGDDELADVCPNVERYEPRKALFPGGDGLAFYQTYAKYAYDALRANGILAVEMGWKQAESVCALLKSQPWSKIEVLQDLAGRDRVVCATKGDGLHAKES